MTEWDNLLDKWQHQWEDSPDEWLNLLHEIEGRVQQAEATGEAVPEAAQAFLEEVASTHKGEDGEPYLAAGAVAGDMQPDEKDTPASFDAAPTVNWRALLHDWKTQLETPPVLYADIWAAIQIAQEEAGGDLPKAVQDFWDEVKTARQREYNELRQAAEDIYNDPSLLPAQKVDPFDKVLAPRLYPGEDRDSQLVEMRASLSDPKHRRNAELTLAYVHYQLEKISEQQLPYQDQNDLLRECRTALEVIKKAVRDVAELADLKEQVASVFSRVNDEKGRLAQYIQERGETRALKKTWVKSIKENQAKINAGITTEKRDGESVDLIQETQLLEREYAQDALDTARRKFSDATGANDATWRESGQRLNPNYNIGTVLKDLKVGLITLVPSVYQDKFPDIYVEGDRSIDPPPLALDIQKRDSFSQLQQALNDALEVADKIQRHHAKLGADGVPDEERLRSAYDILEQHSTEDINARIPSLEDVARDAIASQMTSIKGREPGRIWRLDRDTSQLEQLRSAFLRHPLYIESASEDHREFVRAYISELSDLQRRRADCIDQRIAFETQLTKLSELLRAGKLDLAEATRVSEDLTHQYEALGGDSLDREGAQNETATLILGAGLREKYQETAARFEAIADEDKLYAELVRHHDRGEWELAERKGKAAYGDDIPPRNDPRWLSGRSMYLRALAHNLCAQAENLFEDETTKREQYYRDVQAAFDKFQQVAPDEAGQDIQDRIQALREAIDAYRQENAGVINFVNQLGGLIGDHLQFYERDYPAALQKIQAIADDSLRERVHKVFVTGWLAMVKQATEQASQNPDAIDDATYAGIRAGLKTLTEEGLWDAPALERDYYRSLVKVFRLWQSEAIRFRGPFGLALTCDQYEDWYRALPRHFSDAAYSLRHELSEVAAYLRIAEAEKQEDVKRQNREIERAHDQPEQDRHIENARYLLVDALLYSLDWQIVAEYERAGNQAQELPALVEQMQATYRRLLVLPEAADLAPIWEHRVTCWRALLDGQISRALSRLDHLEKLSSQPADASWLKRRCREIIDRFIPDQKRRIQLLINAVLNEARDEETPSSDQLVKILEYALILSQNEDHTSQHVVKTTIERLKPEMSQIAAGLVNDLRYIVERDLPHDLRSAKSRAESLHAQLAAIVAGLSAQGIQNLIHDDSVSEKYKKIADRAGQVSVALTEGVKKHDEALAFFTALITAKVQATNLAAAWDFRRIEDANDHAQKACGGAFDALEQRDTDKKVGLLSDFSEMVANAKRSLLEKQNGTDDIASRPIKDLISGVPRILNGREDPLKQYKDAMCSLETIEEKHRLIQSQLNSYGHLFSSGAPEFRIPDGFFRTRLPVALKLNDEDDIVQELSGLTAHRTIVRELRDRAVKWGAWLNEVNSHYSAVNKSMESLGQWFTYLEELKTVIAGEGKLPGGFGFLDYQYFNRISDSAFSPRNRPPDVVLYEELSEFLDQCCKQLDCLNKYAGKPPEETVPADLAVFFYDRNRLPDEVVNEIKDLRDRNEYLPCLQEIADRLKAQCEIAINGTRDIKTRFDDYIAVLTNQIEAKRQALYYQPGFFDRVFRQRRGLSDQRRADEGQWIGTYSRVRDLLQGR